VSEEEVMVLWNSFGRIHFFFASYARNESIIDKEYRALTRTRNPMNKKLDPR